MLGQGRTVLTFELDLDPITGFTPDFCISIEYLKKLTFEPNPDYSPDARTRLLSPLSYKRC